MTERRRYAFMRLGVILRDGRSIAKLLSCLKRYECILLHESYERFPDGHGKETLATVGFLLKVPLENLDGLRKSLGKLRQHGLGDIRIAVYL